MLAHGKIVFLYHGYTWLFSGFYSPDIRPRDLETAWRKRSCPCTPVTRPVKRFPKTTVIDFHLQTHSLERSMSSTHCHANVNDVSWCLAGRFSPKFRGTKITFEKRVNGTQPMCKTRLHERKPCGLFLGRTFLSRNQNHLPSSQTNFVQEPVPLANTTRDYNNSAWVILHFVLTMLLRIKYQNIIIALLLKFFVL